ncbi:hypothetical protein RQP46_002509 [Phenoliferia psychrophenolica]
MDLLKGPPLPGWDDSNERQKGRYDSLRAAALVCSRWRDPAQRALFDEIHLACAYGMNSTLPNFLASAARSRYRTRSLCARSDSYGFPDAWLEMAVECDGLESLDVHDDTYYKDTRRMSWGDLAQPVFQGLKHLGLMFPENFKDPADISRPLPFKLSSLALWLDDGDPASISCASPNFIRALCDASLPNLSKLSLRVSNPISAARFFTSFTLLGPQLRTLVLAASRKVFEGHFDIFETLQSLTRLDMNLSWDIVEEPAGFEFLGAVLDALPSPPTIKHLRIKIHRLPSDEYLRAVSDNEALGSLIRLELWGFDEKAPLEEKQEARLEAARSVLEERGATIVLGGI